MSLEDAPIRRAPDGGTPAMQEMVAMVERLQSTAKLNARRSVAEGARLGMGFSVRCIEAAAEAAAMAGAGEETAVWLHEAAEAIRRTSVSDELNDVLGD